MDTGKISKVEQVKDQNDRFYQTAELLNDLDESERYNLAYLCRFCREVKENQEVLLRLNLNFIFFYKNLANSICDQISFFFIKISIFDEILDV